MRIKKISILVISILILSQLLIHLPDFIRWQNTPSNQWFTGQVSWFDPWDINVYFSAIGWGRRDGLLFANLYDTQPTKPLSIYTLYTLLGKLFASFDLSNAAIFHLTAIITGLLVSLVIWQFSSLFLQKETDRLLTLFFAVIGGGIGWLLYPRVMASDLSQPGFTLYSALRRPHEALSSSLFLLTLIYFYKALLDKQIQPLRYLVASVLLFLLLLFHPYSVLTLGLVLTVYGIYWLGKTESLKYLLPSVVVFFTSAIYYLFIGRGLLANPSFAGLARQVQSSPTPVQTILGWGFLFPFVVVALLTPGENKKELFLKIWFLTHWTILYIPLSFQRLLVRGLWVCVVLLAVKGVRTVAERYKTSWLSLVVFLVLLASPSSILIFIQRLKEPATNRWIYLTVSEKKIIDFLNEQGTDEEGVLAEYRLSNIIPANTRKRVYAGHEFQTPDFRERIVSVNRFYSGKFTMSEARTFLQQADIKWIIWGPDEKAMANLTDLPYSSLIHPILETKEASLYKVF